MNYANYQAQYAETNARAVLERTLVELDRYIERFEQADSLNNKADVLNWTLNHLTTYISCNVRLDLIAQAQAELVRADTMAE